MTRPLLQVEGLVKHFHRGGGFGGGPRQTVHAVNGVSFDVQRGEIVGVVGESGCGKSTLAKAIVRLHQPTAGRVFFDGADISSLSERELFSYRRRIQFVFQDPYSSLNPRMTVRALLAEPVKLHDVVPRAELEPYLIELIRRVGLRPDALDRFPHEFSGGQRQRIVIARALAMKPELLIADEPVSALDVSVQAQIINLLLDLKEQLDLTLVFITHDLKLIERLCDRVLVLYLGRLVEEVPARGISRNARHPYTRSLLAAIPIDDPDQRRERPLLGGQPPNPLSLPSGCVFTGRCPQVMDRCRTEEPELKALGSAGHRAACHLELHE